MRESQFLKLAGWILGLALAAPIQEAKDSSSADVDGPYVFEGDAGGWIAKRVVRKGNEFAAAVDKLAGPTPEVEVPLPGREKPLHVRLRPVGDPPASRVPAPERLLALSDIEGNLEALIDLLRAAKVVDEDLKWTFAKGHLVVVGDTFDRGLHVTECLWLLYELEARAAAEGGAVHFILGNHEVMNLTGDLRYARKKYHENAALLGEKLGELHSRRTVLGRWLRTRNAIQRIGDELFVHGGISPAVAASKVELQAFNDELRRALLADAWAKPREGTLKLVVDGKEGLVWYRGYVVKPIDEKAMDGILAAFDARRIVVGHCIVEEVGFAIGGRVLTLDVLHAKGVSQAALREGGDWFRLPRDGKRVKLEVPAPAPSPR